jgi:hypothetical protein
MFQNLRIFLTGTDFAWKHKSFGKDNILGQSADIIHRAMIFGAFEHLRRALKLYPKFSVYLDEHNI